MNERIKTRKNIDSLGRIVLPKEARTLFNMENEVELILTEEGILIRNPKNEFIKAEEEKQ